MTSKSKLIALGIAAAFLVSGCSEPVGKISPAERYEDVETLVALTSDQKALSLSLGTPMHKLSTQLDKVAYSRSAKLQELRAIRARRRATELGRFPTVAPTGSVQLDGKSDPTLGLAVSQMIWDGGRLSARLTDLEHQEMLVQLQLWSERNDAIYQGLTSYVEIQELVEKLQARRQLESTLNRLSDLLDTRLQGGVADRGEVLRLTAAQNDIQRQKMRASSDLKRAKSNLTRLLAGTKKWPNGQSLSSLSDQCQTKWPEVMPPMDAAALADVHRAVAAAALTNARRFPSIVAGTGLDLLSGAVGGVGLRIDASDMLGLGRRAELEAVAAQIDGAVINFKNQQDDTEDTLHQLDQDRESAAMDIGQLRALKRTNTESITLYEEQLESGALQVADGIDLYRNETETKINMIELQADLVRNCIEASRTRGTLARFDLVIPGAAPKEAVPALDVVAAE